MRAVFPALAKSFSLTLSPSLHLSLCSFLLPPFSPVAFWLNTLVLGLSACAYTHAVILPPSAFAVTSWHDANGNSEKSHLPFPCRTANKLHPSTCQDPCEIEASIPKVRSGIPPLLLSPPGQGV